MPMDLRSMKDLSGWKIKVVCIFQEISIFKAFGTQEKKKLAFFEVVYEIKLKCKVQERD